MQSCKAFRGLLSCWCPALVFRLLTGDITPASGFIRCCSQTYGRLMNEPTDTVRELAIYICWHRAAWRKDFTDYDDSFSYQYHTEWHLLYRWWAYKTLMGRYFSTVVKWLDMGWHLKPISHPFWLFSLKEHHCGFIWTFFNIMPFPLLCTSSSNNQSKTN